MRGEELESAGGGLARKKIYTSSREKDEAGAQNWHYEKAIGNGIHIVVECELCEEEWDVLKREMRNVNEGELRQYGKNDGYTRR